MALILVLSLLMLPGAGSGVSAQESAATPAAPTTDTVADADNSDIPPVEQPAEEAPPPDADSDSPGVVDSTDEPPAAEATDPAEGEIPEAADPSTPEDAEVDPVVEPNALGSVTVTFTTNDGGAIPEGATGCLHTDADDYYQCHPVDGNALTFTDLEPGLYWLELLSPYANPNEPGQAPGFGSYSPDYLDGIEVESGQDVQLQVDLIAPGQVTFHVSGSGADSAHVCTLYDLCEDVTGGVAVLSVPPGSWTYSVYDVDWTNVIAEGEYELASGQNLEISVEVDLPESGQVTFSVSGPGADTARVCILGPGTDTCKDVIDGVVVYPAIPAGSWHYDVVDADYNPLASGDYELASGQNLEIDVELSGEPIDLSIDVNLRTSDGGPVPPTTQVCILDDAGNEFECQPATQNYPDPATVHFDQVPSNPFRVITTEAIIYRNVDELVPFADGEGSFQVDLVLQKLGGAISTSVDSPNPAPGSNIEFLTTVQAQLSAEASPWIVTSDAPFTVFGIACVPAPESGSCETGSDSDPTVILSPNPATGRFNIEVYSTYVVPNTPGVSYAVTFCAGPTNNPSNRICASDSFTVAGGHMPSTPTPTPDHHPEPPANPSHHSGTSSSSSATVSGLPNTGAEPASSPRGYGALLLSAMLLLLAGFCLTHSPRLRARR
ncbi:MAG: hypothetical protein QM747_00535 [Nocardioides sp.]